KRPLWIGTSCSLFHSPIDLSAETKLEDEVKSWFAFAVQICAEVALLAKPLIAPDGEYDEQLSQYSAPIRQREHSSRV
ncbi:5-methyltetrahydropteroyltriglutamate--homocysteine S-methyltransferase, partial [Proteus mirabilis]|nr:5-methyltetrahydropteroyltriglutamate--homocysteine S-methyltransferase [Proteus mirabilis]